MDTNLLTGTVYSAGITTVFAIAFAVYKCINHRQVVSKCCGRKMDMSLDINETPRARASLNSSASTSSVSVPLLMKMPQPTVE